MANSEDKVWVYNASGVCSFCAMSSIYVQQSLLPVGTRCQNTNCTNVVTQGSRPAVGFWESCGLEELADIVYGQEDHNR